MKLTVDQLIRAAGIARNIAELELARDRAEDTPADVHVNLGAPSAANPMGHMLIGVTVHANDIRMVLVNRLTPLYTELRNLGIELQL